MDEVLSEHLQFLYGTERARVLLARVQTLAASYGPQIPPVLRGPGRSSLDQRDSILIAYADQVQESGVQPLLVLESFLRLHILGTISGLHLLPFYPSSSDDGFSVVDYYGVDPAFGNWEEIARLGESFHLMFDAVINHLSTQSRWFHSFLEEAPGYRQFFISIDGAPDLSQVVRPRALPLLTEFQSKQRPVRAWTTFSADQADLNFANPDVLLAILEVLLFYVTKGARWIRLDAIAFLWKKIGTSCLHLPQTHRTVQLVRTFLDIVAPRVTLVTETNVPHADNVSYFGDGTNEAQLVYNFALPPLVLHSFALGSTDALTRWARSLDLPSSHVTFFNFLASHDGIGLNPARGILSEDQIERLVDRTLAHGGLVSYKTLPDGGRAPYELNINYFDALSNPAEPEPLALQIMRFVCAHALMFSLPGVPGIYFHSLFGSRGDRAGAESSGIPRRINRQKLQRVQLESDLARSGSLRQRVFEELKRLLTLRRSQPAFAPSSLAEVLSVDSRVFAIRRASGERPGNALLCIHNVSAETVTVRLDTSNFGGRRPWQALYQTGAPVTGVDISNTLFLAPYAVWWGA